MDVLNSKLSLAKAFNRKGDGDLPDLLLSNSIRHSAKKGLFMEFGVAKGRTLDQIRRFMDRESISENLYGFDSFNGLPENWVEATGRICHVKGQFSCEPPKVGSNTFLLVGLFQDTLTEFLAKHPEPVAFAHIDCDLYSSTSFVLHQLRERIVKGTVLEFDEMCGEPEYIQHEGKAFCEFIEASGMDYDILGKTRVAVAIKFK